MGPPNALLFITHYSYAYSVHYNLNIVLHMYSSHERWKNFQFSVDIIIFLWRILIYFTTIRWEQRLLTNGSLDIYLDIYN